MSEFILQIIGVCIILFIIGLVVYPIYKGIREQDKKTILLHARIGQYSGKLVAIKTLCKLIKDTGRQPSQMDIDTILNIVDLEINREEGKPNG